MPSLPSSLSAFASVPRQKPSPQHATKGAQQTNTAVTCTQRSRLGPLLPASLPYPSTALNAASAPLIVPMQTWPGIELADLDGNTNILPIITAILPKFCGLSSNKLCRNLNKCYNYLFRELLEHMTREIQVFKHPGTFKPTRDESK